MLEEERRVLARLSEGIGTVGRSRGVWSERAASRGKGVSESANNDTDEAAKVGDKGRKGISKRMD